MPEEKSLGVKKLDTQELDGVDNDRRANDYGNVPLVNGTEVLTDNEEISRRQRHLESLQESLDSADITTRRSKVKRLTEKISEKEKSLVFEVDEEEVGDGKYSTDSDKKQYVEKVTDLDLDGIDHRLFTTILLAHQRSEVAEIQTSSKYLKLFLSEDAMDTDKCTKHYIELSKVGDGIVVQGRCMYEETDTNRSFPETYLQENDILDHVFRMIVEKKNWGAFW